MRNYTDYLKKSVGISNHFKVESNINALNHRFSEGIVHRKPSKGLSLLINWRNLYIKAWGIEEKPLALWLNKANSVDQETTGEKQMD